MRADIHGGPEHALQSEAGYIDARPKSRQIDETSCDARPDHTIGSGDLRAQVATVTALSLGNAALRARLVWVLPIPRHQKNKILCS
jgi:hypothetical protein